MKQKFSDNQLHIMKNHSLRERGKNETNPLITLPLPRDTLCTTNSRSCFVREITRSNLTKQDGLTELERQRSEFGEAEVAVICEAMS